MAMGKRFKGLFVLLMVAVLFLNSIPASAAELGLGRATAGDFVSEETSFSGGEGAEPSAIVPLDPGPGGHQFREGGRIVLVREATCATTGLKYQYCAVKNCKSHSPKSISIPKDKNNHENLKTSYYAATCLKEGKKVEHCSACGYTKTEKIAKKSHTWVSVNEPRGCFSDGKQGRRCNVCQTEEITIIKAYGCHNMTYHYTPPSLDSEGKEWYKCERCAYEKTISIIPRLRPNDPEPIPGTDEPSNPSQPSDPGTPEPTPNEPNMPNQDSQISSAKTADNMENPNIESVYAGDPVNVFTGAHEIDFNVISAGGAQNLTVGLSYKSNKTIESIFGKGFSWNYESYVEEKDGKILLYHSPSEYVTYSKDNGNSFYTTEATGSESDRLYKNNDNTVMLKSNGKTFVYNASGKLIRYTGKTGNSTSIEYKEGQTVLKDDVSGQTITLFFNDKNLVIKAANSGTAEAFFEYDDKNRIVKFTDVDGFVTQYTYDDSDRVLTGTDNDGNVFFDNTYDEEGRIVKQKDASKKETSFAYTDNGEAGKTTVFTDRNGNTKTHTFSKEGRLLSLTDEEGNTTFNEYDAGGNCIKKTDALGNSNLMEYDDRHNLVKATDALGNVTEFTYDENDNPIKITYPNGSEVTSTYDSNNRLVSTTDVRGLTTNNTYDENGFLIKTESGDKVSTLTYENGNLKTVTDSLGNVTAYIYDENGNLIETKAPDGAVVSQTVSAFGAVKSTKDALNNEKFYTRNCFDKPLSVKDEAGYVTEYSYDERQLLKESKDSKENITSYTYDNEERLVKTTYPDGTYTENLYDKTGRLVGTVDAEGNRTSVEYDKAGRVVKETDREGNSTEISYDANGNVISRKDAKGNLTTYTYDEMGRVSTVTNAFNGVTEYTYNDAGDLLSVKAPTGEITYYTYDIYGRKTSETDPNGNVTQFEYDLNGNLIKSIDALNNETTFEYDECNRLVSTKKGEVVIAVEYDLKGQTVATIDALGHRSETVYDERGYVSKSIDALGNETSYTYDGNGNLVSVTDANGHTTTYTVNNVNQVTSVTDALELTTSFAYDKNGRRNKSTNPMGGVSTCIFDKTGNALTLTGPEGATTDFTYDANGNLTSRSTVAGNSAKYTYNALNLAKDFTNGREQTTTYEYDSSGRIVKSVSPEGAVTYTYDGNSNILTVTDASGTISRTYDALNRVTSVTDTKGRVVSYEYDSYGNLKTLTYPDNTSVTYTYDLCGNIKTVTDWEGRVTAYAYDALNREIQAVTTSNKEDFGINLSSYGAWESGEYSDSTGEKADHRRRMRYPERLAVDSSAYNVELSEGYKLRICEYNQYDAYMRYFDVKGGEAYRPTDEAESFSITLIKLEGEKSLSPGQWNRLFSSGVNVSLSASRRGNGTTVTKEYDAVGNLVKTTAKKNTNGKVIDETIYEYDEINRLVSESRPHRNFKYVYEYDNLSRVTKRSTITLSTGESCYDEVFEYDGAGNINTVEQGTYSSSLTYNTSDNIIESFDNVAFGFDNDGNLVYADLSENGTYEIEGLIADDANASLSYDSHNRLTGGVLSAKGVVPNVNVDASLSASINYRYDAEDYRTYSSINAEAHADVPGGLMSSDSLESVPESETVTDITDEPESDAVSDNDIVSGNDAVSDDNTVSDNDAVSGNDSVPGKEIQEEANEEDSDVSEGDILPVMPEPETDTDSLENGEITVLSGNIETEEVSDSNETEAEPGDVSENAESDEQEISAEPEEEKLDEESVSENTISSLEERLINRIDESSLEDIVTKEENFDSITSVMESTTILEYYEAYEYCYDRENKNLLVRYSEDGTLEKYVYGNGLIASSETRESQSPKYRTYLYDLRGSVTFTLDSSANITSEYQYSTYGNRNVIKGSTTSELGYCARDGVLTEVTGLLYMRARYYMPNLMRFINQDIVAGDISNSNSLNRYTYVEGNPATMIDPFGLCAEKSDNNIRSLMSLLDEFEVGIVKWNKSAITYENMSVLYDTLVKYNIILPEQICAFLACCTLETGDGTQLTEDYPENARYPFKYRGGGYIHLTFDYGYKSYAMYKILESSSDFKEYMENDAKLKEYAKNIWLLKEQNDRYDKFIEGIDKYKLYLGEDGEAWYKNSVEPYIRIDSEGAEYVASDFAWDSAGFYWSEGKKINEKINSGDSEEKIRDAISKVNPGGKGLDIKMEYYSKLLSLFSGLER